MGKKIKSPFKARELFWKTFPVLLLIYAFIYALAGGIVVFIVKIDLSREFYSAHRGFNSVQELLMPAIVTAAITALILTAIVTWIALRYFTRKLTGPVLRTDDMLRRLAKGDLTYAPVVLTKRQRWALDDTADAMLEAFRERALDIKKETKELQNAILALRYKATGSDSLTLKELREITSSIEGLCKDLSLTVKWFET